MHEQWRYQHSFNELIYYINEMHRLWDLLDKIDLYILQTEEQQIYVYLKFPKDLAMNKKIKMCLL